MKSKLTPEYFRKMYKYEPLTGQIVSNYCGYRMNFGQLIALTPHPGGYLKARIDGVSYFVHRLAVLYMTGKFPIVGTEVDHINRNRSDNRWENLRVVTSSQNNINRSILNSNTSGIAGVSWDKTRFVWRVKISHNGTVINVGSYTSKDAAVAARKIAEAKYYGEFAPQE